jgi:ubiquinone/menaquinone biosynthesis C-methylase UbiE
MTGKAMQDRDLFDQYADNYSAEIDKSLGAFGTEHDFFTQHKAWLIDRILVKSGRNPAKMSLLDVGCGVGKIHGTLKGLMQKVSGVDISAESIRIAKEDHVQCDYKTYDGQHLPYADGSFDMAMAICVFHHIPPAQWQQVAAEMLRVVKTNGLVLIIEHNPFNPVTRYIVNSCSFDADAVLLSPRRLRKLFAVPNAQDIATRSILNIPPKSESLRKLDMSLGILPIGAQYYLTATKCDPA